MVGEEARASSGIGWAVDSKRPEGMSRGKRKRTFRANNGEGRVMARIIKMEAAVEAVPVRCIEAKWGRLKAYSGDQNVLSGAGRKRNSHKAIRC